MRRAQIADACAVLVAIAVACTPPHVAEPDAGTPDAGTPDAGTPDAGTPDAGTPDAGTPDAGTPDAGTPDAGPSDGGDYTNPPIPAGYQLMPQADVTPDMTTWAVMILNDPATYPMFATAMMQFGALNVLARVEWHPPDFQNSMWHRGVTLYEPL
jgi:hypothetical protein